jgi:hypothetical protein
MPVAQINKRLSLDLFINTETKREKNKEKETGTRNCVKAEENTATKSNPPSPKTPPLLSHEPHNPPTFASISFSSPSLT